MNSIPLKRLLILFSLLWILGCTSSEHPKVKEIEKQLLAAAEAVTQIETYIKKIPEQDQGLLLKLNQDKQLALSRLARLKENLMALAPNKKIESKSEESSTH